MKNNQDQSTTTSGSRVGILTRTVTARLLNCSPSGCLIETNARVAVGTTGSLAVNLGGQVYVDDVQIVRCQAIEGAGSVYRLGARFLWTDAPIQGTLRSAFELLCCEAGNGGQLVG